MKKSRKGPSAPKLLYVPEGAKMGMVDFSGQDSGYPSASPEAEAKSNADAQPVHSVVATIDDPSRTSESVLFESCDDRLHSLKGFDGT